MNVTLNELKELHRKARRALGSADMAFMPIVGARAWDNELNFAEAAYNEFPALITEIERLRVIEKLARVFTADYAGDPDDHEYEEACAHRFHALKAALDAKPEGEG